MVELPELRAPEPTPPPVLPKRPSLRGPAILAVVSAVVGGLSAYDVLVYTPRFCENETACIPINLLLTQPLMYLSPIVFVGAIIWAMKRRRR